MATKKTPARSATRKPAAISKPPHLGENWKGQGGIYLGIIRGDAGQPDAHLIAAVTGAANLKGPWGPANKVAGANSHRDGLANTSAMAAAGSQLAKVALGAKIEGHKDFYLPARDEARLAYVNGREHFEKSDWYWTSTQSEALDSNAFVQDFAYGGQGHYHKSLEHRAFLVRRIPIR